MAPALHRSERDEGFNAEGTEGRRGAGREETGIAEPQLENIYVRHNLGAQAAGVQFEDRPPAPQVVCSESLV